jgi:hypothetical protein
VFVFVFVFIFQSLWRRSIGQHRCSHRGRCILEVVCHFMPRNDEDPRSDEPCTIFQVP